MKRSALFTIILLTFAFSAFAQRFPLIYQIKQVSQLPAEIPQRVQALAFDGKKLWFALYHDKGRYATFNPRTKEWKYSDSEIQHQSISRIARPRAGVGGMVFVNKRLWVSSAYGASFGYINTSDWQVGQIFSPKVRPDLKDTQSYADMTYDGKYIWIAWHLGNYQLPDSEVQQLLKVETENGEILEKYPLPIGSRQDSTHGLTFDGEILWHIKGRNLSAIDLKGRLLGQFKLMELRRPSGIVWDGKSLWIVEFDGKLWNLPVKR